MAGRRSLLGLAPLLLLAACGRGAEPAPSALRPDEARALDRAAAMIAEPPSDAPSAPASSDSGAN